MRIAEIGTLVGLYVAGSHNDKDYKLLMAERKLRADFPSASVDPVTFTREPKINISGIPEGGDQLAIEALRERFPDAQVIKTKTYGREQKFVRITARV